MPRYRLQPPLVPRAGGVLRVLGIVRISTLNQDPKSLEDQKALLMQWVTERYDGPVEWRFIESQGSGEWVDRKEIAEIYDEVESGQYDLVIMEDLARYMRRAHAVLFCEQCEDNNTRLVAKNDSIDTSGDWRLHAFFAAIKHEQSNKDTSERIKRTLRNRFQHGEVLPCPIYGYIKPPGAAHENHLKKDTDAQPIYEEWFRRLDEGATFAEIADWLNASEVPLGPYLRGDRWIGTMIGRITRNPILKGVRVRNRVISKRHNKTGRHRAVKAAPEERLERHCPHLAFFDADYYDRVVAKVNARNAKYRRKGEEGIDPRRNISNKRTRFPGQCIYCGICGRLYVFGGHGRKDHLMCSGARQHVCWNGVTVDGPLAANRIAAAFLQEVAKLEDYDATFLAMVTEESSKLDSAREGRLKELSHTRERQEREIQNLVKFIREGGSSPLIHADLQRLEGERGRLDWEIRDWQNKPTNAVVLPSVDEIRELGRAAVRDLPIESFEFADRMRKLVGKIFVHPFIPVDHGELVLRATVILQLAKLVPDARARDVLAQPMAKTLTIDLFDPPQRVAYRERIIAMRENATEREVAHELGLTLTASQRAAKLDRLMRARGLIDPYLPVTEPPADNAQFRRCRHPRYKFDPLPATVQD